MNISLGGKPMLNRNEELKQYLVPGKHVHLVGIGGVSMRPLGLVLKGMGLLVTGSDMNASVSTEELISKGIHVATFQTPPSPGRFILADRGGILMNYARQKGGGAYVEGILEISGITISVSVQASIPITE